MDKEHELLALKARKARILNGLPEPKRLVWNEENAQTIKELCEVESRIAQLEGKNTLDIYKVVLNDELQEMMQETTSDFTHADVQQHPSKPPEQELEALKKRRARLWNSFSGPRTLDGDETSKQRYEELCEVNDRIALLEKTDDDPEQTEYAPDHVNHPSHYTSGGIECIDAMKAMLTGYEQAKLVTKFYWHFLSGQVLKYLWRWPLKERPLQDLKKARWYLDRLIEDLEKQDENYVRKEASK